MTHQVDRIVETAAPGRRLLSLDALRGFDMFWIMGGESIVHAAATLTAWAPLVWLEGQMHHPKWNGFTLYDLIFPLFLFMAGVSMPFSFEKRIERGDTRGQLFRHVIIRGLLLVLIGMIYNGFLNFDWPKTRYPSVLGRIGLAYLFAGLIVLSTGVRGRVLWLIGVLVGYWAALRFIPVPGYGAHDLAPGHTLTDFIDQTLLPGRLYVGTHDPEGLLGTVPAIGTALFGALTGEWLKSERSSGYQKAAGMFLAAAVCLALAWTWNIEFPINKNLWTSSFVLNCAGLSLMLMAIFYLVIDVWGFKRLAFPLIVIGSNSILIYVAPTFIDFNYATHFFFGGALAKTGAYQALLFATAVVLVKWLLLYLLYKKRIFLRV